MGWWAVGRLPYLPTRLLSYLPTRLRSCLPTHVLPVLKYLLLVSRPGWDMGWRGCCESASGGGSRG
eukprot:2545755-Rhodomonas_salina.1